MHTEYGVNHGGDLIGLDFGSCGIEMDGVFVQILMLQSVRVC